uniref:Uncharacterized protein n=1 Tax=Picea glauca TaxID=3330 RepID=A0A101LZS6_PICGL|nr:hypothetical protein ABT39_MTgene5285 [Picea glauca]QHR88860.1 hypothetical protein Q903MT_gene2879 [Picea sitchensis]
MPDEAASYILSTRFKEGMEWAQPPPHPPYHSVSFPPALITQLSSSSIYPPPARFQGPV